MKKVLIIAHSFPPVNNAGAARSAGFVGQLAIYGWEPLVLTHTVRTDTNKDMAMQVPEGIDVIRTGAWEPENLPGILQPVGKALSSLLIPDAERLWELFSIRKAVRMAKYEGVDMIYTVSPPSSAHLIGLRLKKKYPGVPWVADLCGPLPGAGGKIRDRFYMKLKDRILNEADCIITGNKETYDKLLSENGTEGSQETICYVPDGNAQLLSEQFEKACRVIAARKITKNNEDL